MNIEPPKDAKGREIPFDTKVLYDRYGNKNDVRLFAYFANSDTWRVRFTYSNTSYFAVNDLYLDQPDSWKALEEDLDRVARYSENDAPACIYAHQPCAVCKLHASEDCTNAMCADILSRIRKLRATANE